MAHIIDATYIDSDNNLKTYSDVLRDLHATNSAVPDITHVQYQFGMKRIYRTDADGKFILDENNKRILDTDKSYPILTTILTFADNSTSIVMNSKADGLQLDADGQPTEIAKEIGLIYAFAKRILSGKLKTDDDGNLTISYAGFGNVLRKLVHSADPASAKPAPTPAPVKAKSGNPSLAKTVCVLSETVKTLSEVVSSLKSDIADIKARS